MTQEQIVYGEIRNIVLNEKLNSNVKMTVNTLNKVIIKLNNKLDLYEKSYINGIINSEKYSNKIKEIEKMLEIKLQERGCTL